MSLATSNRDGGKTSESGHLRAIMKGLKAQVLTGLNVSQRGAGANMSVDVAIGDAVIPRSDATYGHPAWNDAVYNQVISAADGSNPRRDIIVMYIDYGQTPSTAVSNNTNGVVKIKQVAGTPAGSPTDPSNATIQSSVGSGNPFIKLARVRVGTGVTTISNSVIDDLRLLATGLEQGGWQYDELYTWNYASTTTFTVTGVDVTAQFPVGSKVALYQSGSIKYFVVTGSAFSTNTTVTLDGLGTYTLANVPIDRPAFSYDETPVGFPVVGAQVYNPYKVHGTRQAALNSPNGSFQNIAFDSEDFDTGANFDIATNQGRFTATVPGYYWFYGRASAATSSQFLLALAKNGSTYNRGGHTLTGSGTVGVTYGCMLKLAAGDYVNLQSFGSGGAFEVGSGCYFGGYLVSRV